MGLVTKTYVQHTPGSRVCTEGSSSSNYEEGQSFDKTIYRIFSMQDDMKTYSFNGRVRNEFEQFISDAISKTEMLGYNTAFDSLDEYLGTLGVTRGIC